MTKREEHRRRQACACLSFAPKALITVRTTAGEARGRSRSIITPGCRRQAPSVGKVGVPGGSRSMPLSGEL